MKVTRDQIRNSASLRQEILQGSQHLLSGNMKMATIKDHGGSEIG